MDSTMHKTRNKILLYVLSIFVFLLGLELCSLIVNQPIFFPSVFQILSSFGKLLGTSRTYLYIGNTVKNLLFSLLISFGIGAVLGILGGLFSYVHIFFKPWITILRCIPISGCIVILMILSGLNKTPYIVCSLMLIPIIYEGFYQGITSLDSTMMDVWKLNSKLSFKVLWKVHIPLIVSFIKTTFISALGLGIKIVLMGEYLAGVANTLGYAIIPAAAMLEYDVVFAYCILIVVLILILEQIPKGIYHGLGYFRFKKSQHLKEKVI